MRILYSQNRNWIRVENGWVHVIARGDLLYIDGALSELDLVL